MFWRPRPNEFLVVGNNVCAEKREGVGIMVGPHPGGSACLQCRPIFSAGFVCINVFSIFLRLVFVIIRSPLMIFSQLDAVVRADLS